MLLTNNNLLKSWWCKDSIFRAALAASCRLSENTIVFASSEVCFKKLNNCVANSCEVFAKPLRNERIGDAGRILW